MAGAGTRRSRTGRNVEVGSEASDRGSQPTAEPEGAISRMTLLPHPRAGPGLGGSSCTGPDAMGGRAAGVRTPWGVELHGSGRHGGSSCTGPDAMGGRAAHGGRPACLISGRVEVCRWCRPRRRRRVCSSRHHGVGGCAVHGPMASAGVQFTAPWRRRLCSSRPHGVGGCAVHAPMASAVQTRGKARASTHPLIPRPLPAPRSARSAPPPPAGSTGAGPCGSRADPPAQGPPASRPA